MSKEYLSRNERRQKILDAALKLAVINGFSSLSRDGVALEANAAAGSVNYCFDNMQGLKDAVITHAIDNLKSATSRDRRQSLALVAQGVMAENEIALTAPLELRKEAFNSMT